MKQFYTYQSKQGNLLFFGLGIGLGEAVAPPRAAGKASPSRGTSPSLLNARTILTFPYYRDYMLIIPLISMLCLFRSRQMPKTLTWPVGQL